MQQIQIFFLICFISLFSIFTAKAQVQKVHYFLKYNDETCLFDFCIIIKEGQAITLQQRVQLNAQYTVVVPTGSIVIMAQKHMPLQSNQTYNGTIPMDWQLGSIVTAPQAQPGSDFYSVIPTLAPTSFYNNVYLNDTIPLFSLGISPILDCANGIRIFDNLNDPGPIAPGMNGSNFSNGFTMGGIQNKYDGNAISVLPKRPVIHQLNASCSHGLELDVDASPAMTNCQRSLTFLWNGPEGFSSTDQNIHMPEAGKLQNGMYTITVKDSLGCSVMDSIIAYSKPDAGKNQRVNCFSSGIATLKASGTGQWSFASGNPGTAEFSNEYEIITTVSDFSAPGIYKAVWSSSGCHDTISIDVGVQCQCSFINALEIPSVFLFCSKANDIPIIGNEIVDQGQYKWLYRINQEPFQEAPGNSMGKDYIVPLLSSGEHTFVRVFTKLVEPVCIDTSNAVYLLVSPTIDAGEDIDVFCYETDTAFVQASGTGQWILNPESAGLLDIIQYGNPEQNFNNFNVPGIYSLTWTNDVCRDTLLIHANPYCGCFEAQGGEDVSICAGDTLLLEGTCKVGTWLSLPGNPPGDTIFMDQNGIANIAFINSAFGEYLYQYSVFDSLFDTVKVMVHSLPVINVGEDFGFCENSPPVVLVAGGGVSYVWSTTETTPNIMISPTTTTTYKVIGYNEFGCLGSDSITVFILPKPEGQIPPLPVVNQGATVYFMAGLWSNAVSYFWQGPNGFTSNQQNPVLENITKDFAGVYQLTVTSADECVTTSTVTLVVNQNSLPVNISEFTGRYLDSKHINFLEWDVYQIINHDYFMVEKSEDGQNFSTITKIISKGKPGRYEFSDEEIKSGQHYYYRLKSFDVDGTQQILGVVDIYVSGNMYGAFSLYPIPAQDRIFLTVNKEIIESSISIEIYNTVGQIIYSVINDPTQSYNLLEDFDLANVKPGIYKVKISIGDIYLIKPFIKID